jgi:predicted enzyme related to lactoylglutathione lyase
MTIGHFIWTDISTYDMTAGRADYAALFKWSFGGDDAYAFGRLDGQDVAGLFPMPPRLADMDMPSFWMSYVHVADVQAIVAKARRHEGVIIEVEPEAFGDDARIALVRDPSGAGFTLYEGPDITPTADGHGVVESRFHHLPDAAAIRDFYSDLFGWTFNEVADQPWPTFDLLHPDGTTVARAEEVPATIRGKFSYWMPCFAVASQEDFKWLVLENGGEILSDLPDGRAIVADRQGAHFMIREKAGAARRSAPSSPAAGASRSGGFAWKAVLGLACVWLAVLFDIQAFWGVLFLIWTWPAIRSGRADFVEPVFRQRQPIVYWGLVGTWLVLSVWLIALTISRLI